MERSNDIEQHETQNDEEYQIVEREDSLSQGDEGEYSPETSQNQNSSTFKSRMLLSKIATKEIEKEAKNLANRIAYLDMQEQKVLKKIDETRQKALEIMKVKIRNKDSQTEKEKQQERLEKQLQKKKEQAQQKAKELRSGLQDAHENKVAMSHSKAQEIKENMKKLKERYRKEKKAEQINKLQNASTIKEFEKQIENKRKEELERIAEEARIRYEQKIDEEERKRIELEDEIIHLENKERELIKRLKNTQNFHQMVVEDLDRIVKDEEPVNEELKAHIVQ